MTVDQRIALIKSYGFETRCDGLNNVSARRIRQVSNRQMYGWEDVSNLIDGELIEWLRAD